MSQESFNRLLEYSHKMIAMEVDNHFIPRNEPHLLTTNKPNCHHHYNFGSKSYGWTPFNHKKLCKRSEYKALETKYLIGRETIEKLEKELKLLKETQEGFR